MGNFNKNSTHNKIPFFQLLLQINSSHPLLHCLNKFHFLNIFKLKTVLAVDVVVVFFYFILNFVQMEKLITYFRDVFDKSLKDALPQDAHTTKPN